MWEEEKWYRDRFEFWTKEEIPEFRHQSILNRTGSLTSTYRVANATLSWVWFLNAA